MRSEDRARTPGSGLLPSRAGARARPIFRPTDHRARGATQRREDSFPVRLREYMPKHGKKFREAQSRVPQDSSYAPAEAVSLVKELSFAKFDETVEAAVRLGVDPRHADQIVRGAVVLPHGTGKTARVLVIAQGDKAREAEEAGADFVGTEYVQRIKDGWLDFDVVGASPDMMGQVGQLGRILGPRGL